MGPALLDGFGQYPYGCAGQLNSDIKAAMVDETKRRDMASEPFRGEFDVPSSWDSLIHVRKKRMPQMERNMHPIFCNKPIYAGVWRRSFREVANLPVITRLTTHVRIVQSITSGRDFKKECSKRCMAWTWH
ncbi:hypothetical protein ACRALDRAFT_212501 [Sodiomyces alcalophilus JCM 7366]|uniref:uncharacterized protein n=1 Tax=Sodiomyces alcalophilus JCM 7366 TaxID=591952 RepID=UPI0039B4DD15